MARRRRLFEMTLRDPIADIKMSAFALTDDETLRRVREAVDGRPKIDDLMPFPMRPSRGYISLGIRDVRDSPPPVLEDAQLRAVNRARAEEEKKKKDAKEAKCTKKLLTREKLDAHRQRQKLDGLPLEPSLSSSVSDSSGDGDGHDMGTACLEHLPDIREMVPGAPARSLTPLGGGGVSGLVAAHLGAKADMPEARVSEERAVSPMGPTVEVERATVGPTPSSLQKHLVEDPALVPRKALKVNISSSAHQAAEAQAGVQRGAASSGAVSKEAAAQEKGAEAAAERVEEEEPTPRDVVSLRAKEAGASTIVEAIEGEAGAPKASEAELATAKEQSAPLVAKIKELEEERDAFRSRAQEATASAKALAEQLGAEQSEHQLTKVALAEATKAAEASRAEALDWKSKAEDLEKEASQVAKASIAAQAALDVEVREHEALRSAVQDDEEADVEVAKLLEATEAPGAALAGLFEEEVVPPAPTADP
ncbi:uncharacterized protein [Miscanthus floridulus]|uniref:uncharacterized protein n=1 Tax=Miscanthus floridulus TaxID=154761 RepID=UPI00345896E1